jgi:hypothetical protein
MKQPIRQSLLPWVLLACLLLMLVEFAVPPKPGLAGPLQTMPINFGTVTSGSINQPGEIDSYTFSANSGDLILIGATRTSGDLWPRIRLFSPEGTLLQDQKNAVHVEITQELHNLNKIFLPVIANGPGKLVDRSIFPDPEALIIAQVPGTYTIWVSDGFDGTFTGSYNLYLQKLNPPVGAEPIAYSETLSGSINLPAEMDAFIFSPAKGDKVIIGMSSVSGDLWQQIRLYDSRGVLLQEVKHPKHVEISFDIQDSGDHFLLVSDGFRGELTGSYNVFIQRRVNPANATVIDFGQTIAGSINQPAEMDAFAFSAKAGDQVNILMTSISGDLWQQIRLYDPIGNLLNENSGVNQAEITQSIPSNGTYTIFASDGFNGTFTGSYNMTLQKLP